MKLFVIGFPKSGTTTLTVALRQSGLKTAHWRVENHVFVGSMIYRSLLDGADPLAGLAHYDAITQADVCIPRLHLSRWPNLDFSVLRAIRKAHPTCLFLLNYRDPEAICDSMVRWPGLQARLVKSDIPGLPSGIGDSPQHLIRWIENHFDACRNYFADDPHFLEIDIASEAAPVALGKALGIPIKGWGDHKPSTFRAGAVASPAEAKLISK